MPTTLVTDWRELADRSGDGLDVRLWWSSSTAASRSRSRTTAAVTTSSSTSTAPTRSTPSVTRSPT